MEILYQVINAFLGGLIIAVIAMTFVFWQRWKNSRESEGKILCHFFTQGGGYFYSLCKVDKGRVEPPKEHDIGEYFVTPDCQFSGKWKPGQPKVMQVGVPTTAFIENVREPKVSIKPKEWIENPEKHKITAFMQKTAINESAMKTAVALQTSVWKDIASMAQFIKNVPYMFYISLGLLAGMIVIGYMVYMVMARLSAMGV